MADDMFTGRAEGSSSPVRSEIGEAVPTTARSAVRREKTVRPASLGFGGATIRRTDDGPLLLKGRGPAPVDTRKFRYDVTRGQAERLPFAVTRDDRMSAVEAGRALHRIHEVMGVDRENEDFLYAFDSALFFCHAVNGASVLGPGRATFLVPGVSQSFLFGTVRDVLGTSLRRFFRAFADDTVKVIKRVLDDYDPDDEQLAEAWGWVQEAAAGRGLMRYPYLCFDSADACLKLNAVERAAVAASKVMVISTSNNSADRLKANPRVSSADDFDSTVSA